MANSKTTKVWSICIATAVFALSAPATSQGCEFLERLMPWNWCRGSETPAATYAPAYAVQCPTPVQTCCYVPQTSYRTVLQTAPATVYRPTTCCDPCTGCATTCYSPITTYVRSAQLVPYTTYTPVWTTSSCYASCGTSCSPCASPCGTSCGTSCGSTDYSYTTTAPSGCSSCGTPAPSSTSTLAPTPMQGSMTTQPSGAGAGTVQPSLPGSTTPPTYKQNMPIKPVPEDDIRGSSHKGPRLEGPAIDPLTSRPVRQANYQEVSYKTGETNSAGESRFDYDGWHASNK